MRFITSGCHVRAASLIIGLLLWASSARASFHLMQIEQVIGGVNGDTSAQAIQLRMRTSFQNLVGQGRLRAWDAAGLNPVLVLDLTSNVSNSATGARVLVCTSAFVAKTSPACVPDAVMTSPIPVSYLAAGRLTFEDDFGTIYWSLSWGGAAYTGPQTGSTVNDSNGNFGPAFAGVCPSTTTQALQFTGGATALSTTNAAQYAVTAGAAVFSNNAGSSFTVNSSCSLTITSQPDPPDITRVGDQVDFSVAVSGDPTISYSWRRDGTPLSDDGRIMGSATAALTITSAEGGDTGNYDVVVSNGCDSETSDPVHLTVYCLADFDYNEFVNGEDFDAFVFFFIEGDSQADINQDMFVTGEDFDLYADHFVAGC